MRARLDTGLKSLGVFSLLRVWQRVTGTPGTFLEGRGRVLPPLVPFSHARFFVPFAFFSFFASLGPWAC